MGNHSYYVDPDIIGDVVDEYVKSQPWYKKNANTITTAIGITATIASSLVSSGLSLPPWAITLATAITGLATVFGVKKTKNGIQPDAASKLVG